MPNRHGNVNSLTPFEGKWRNGATKTIRVPVALAEQVIAVAREMDSGFNSLDTSDSGSEILTSDVIAELLAIKVKIEAKEAGYRANSASKLVSALKAVFDKL